MVASEFEYRHRFWMILLVYAVAYAFYNLDHLNILYSIVPWNRGVVQRDMLVRILYAAAALLAASRRPHRSRSLLERRAVPLRPQPAIHLLFSSHPCLGHVSEPPWISGDAPRRSVLAVAPDRPRRTPSRSGLRRPFSRLRTTRSSSLSLSCSARRGRRPSTSMAPSPLGPSFPMGSRHHAARLRLHLKRPCRLRIRGCNPLVFSSAETCTTALWSIASHLTTVLSFERNIANAR
jgi:hypothetical protein